MFGIEKDFQNLMEQVYGPLSEPVKYETPMTKNEEEIEKVKAQIKVLEKKLSFLEELEKTQSPMEEAYKRVYGFYPETYENSWNAFQAGYKSAQKDYKVGEFQESEEEPEELKTLYQMFCDKYWPKPNCDVFCDIVKEWMSQYTHNVMSGEYLEGYNGCLTVLKENLE